MPSATNYEELPDNLPAPEDDGRCDHLPGLRMPSIPLMATDGRTIDLAALRGRTVVYAYPRTGRPDMPSPDGWDAIPGARGCTPQSCAFRDHFQELQRLGAAVYGLSTQDSTYQREAVDRLHLPFPLLSDEQRHLVDALQLPTFEIDGMTMTKRVTLIINDGRIENVFYPVFPPNRNAEDVIDWLTTHQTV